VSHGRALPLAALGFVALAAAGCPGKLGGQQGHAPVQPIAFSHALHAGLYELDCQYCHAGAERSRHAGVPSAGVCLNCHSQVKTDSPEIRKLTAYVKGDQPVPWTKVHRLPDFAFFNHASHVSAGLACQGCHGPVQQMVRVEQQETMTMGWCLSCHREVRDEGREAPLPLATLAMNHLDEAAKAPPRHLQPPTDCSACHR
jgi:hypothetical protein